MQLKILGDHEIVSVVIHHVGLHVDITSMKSYLGLQAFNFVCEVNLDGRSPPFRPMRTQRMQWSRAFSLVSEVGPKEEVVVNLLTKGHVAHRRRRRRRQH